MGDTLNALGESNSDPSPIVGLIPLPPVVTHADGSLVTASRPAKAGETLVLYAVGLGPTVPMIKSGEAAPIPAPSSYVALRFDFSPDTGPSFARLIEPLLASTAASGGASPNLQVGEMTPAFLTPGYVGLYQVNFVVPEPPAGYQNRCGLGALRSNLTVSIGVLYSYDGAGICVEVPVGASATSSAGPNVTRSDR